MQEGCPDGGFLQFLQPVGAHPRCTQEASWREDQGAKSEELRASIQISLNASEIRPCIYKIRPNARFSPKATELPGGSEMTRGATIPEVVVDPT
jgi:hypothetical protein